MFLNRSLFTLFSLTLISVSSQAALGPGSSGGGNELVAEFVTSAHALLERVRFKPADRTALSQAFATSKILTTPVLTDKDGRPVPNQQNLVAFSGPGVIQLKEKSSGNGDSWEEAVAEHRPAAQIVIHELFRASGQVDRTGRSPDDTFQLSIGEYHLNRLDNLGNPLNKVPDLAFWQCQCFEDALAGSPDAGRNLVGLSTLRDAEIEMTRQCKNDFGMVKTAARCLKVVGDPGL